MYIYVLLHVANWQKKKKLATEQEGGPLEGEGPLDFLRR